jgi:hypothetical protein
MGDDRLKKKIIFIFQIVLLLGLLANCGREDEYIIGKWVLVEINVNGQQFVAEDMVEFKVSYNFKIKNEVEIQYRNRKDESKYTLQNIANSSEKEILIDETPQVKILLIEKQIKIIFVTKEGTKNILTLEKLPK